MKKKNVINLIKYHVEKNEPGFRDEAYEVVKYFDSIGDNQFAEYIMSLLSDVNTFVPQIPDSTSSLFEKIDVNNNMLLLPDAITNDLLGAVNAIDHNIGINKFLFK